LELNEKVRENVENCYKIQLCFIQQKSTSRRTDEREKGMNKTPKNFDKLVVVGN
jgi:hypothetical protein